MELTADTVRALLVYDTSTGVFVWRHNADRSIQWNARYAGKLAGASDVKGYQVITIDRKAYKAHRLAYLYVYGRFPHNDIDHANGNKSDNRIENLREATRSQNCANKGLVCTNTSGVKGVSWKRQLRKWCASIKVNRTAIHLGYFNDQNAAQAAYAKAAKEYFGSFSRLISK